MQVSEQIKKPWSQDFYSYISSVAFLILSHFFRHLFLSPYASTALWILPSTLKKASIEVSLSIQSKTQRCNSSSCMEALDSYTTPQIDSSQLEKRTCCSSRGFFSFLPLFEWISTLPPFNALSPSIFQTLNQGRITNCFCIYFELFFSKIM